MAESFHLFRDRLAQHFADISKDVPRLYEVEVDKDEMWNLYLDSFAPKDNQIFRERREFDCSCCRHFIKNFGNVVTIKDGIVTSIWDIDMSDTIYAPVVAALSAYIKSKPIKGIYLAKERVLGTFENTERLDDGTILVHSHFCISIPNQFIFRGRGTLPEELGIQRDIRNVFKRSLDELSMDSIDTVLELIRSNTLYKGKEWERQFEAFRKYKVAYDKLTDGQKELFAWEKSAEAGAVIGKIRNHSIGVLLTDITEGADLNQAVTRYEVMVAPANYKRPKAIFTQKMLDDAKKTLTELGYLDSLARRYAKLDDITVNNILFANRTAAKRIGGAEDIFADMAKQTTKKPQKFDRAEEVTPEVFVRDILPTANEVEVYLENRHTPNFMSLIAPAVAGSKTMFKWANNFSWAYTGNVTDSMKERVKAAGGKVDGDLRFSIQWNEDESKTDHSDLDAHCKLPNGAGEIYFGAPHDRITRGCLDVDITDPSGRVAVENITWATRSTMKPGTYQFFVNQFANRNHQHGFRAEIEFDGQIFKFDYPNSMRTGENVKVADVTLSADGKFTIKEHLTSEATSKEIWGVQTNTFVPVSVICYSPNYWDEQKGIGNQHLFFMLNDCVNPETPNGFYNEFLKGELDAHKRVFEALGARMRVEETDDQLSGLGFSLTKRNDLVVRVKGNTERVIKIKF